MLDGYYYCLNCHSEITPDYNEHCTFCGTTAVAVDGDYSNEEVERAFDLLNKEKQGLVIVPPCKVGDNIYIFQDDENGQAHIVEGVVCNISIGLGCGCIDFKATYNNGLVFWHSEGDGIGYFTREEAEKALEEYTNATD